MKGGVVVVAGHGNTAPAVIQALGGPAGITIGEAEFDRPFALTGAPGKAAVVALRYGKRVKRRGNLLSFAQGGPVISRRTLGLVGCGLLAMGALCAFQKPFRVYPSMEPYDNIPLPPDWQEKAEWVQARLMYPQHPDARFARFRYGRLDWREGGTSWTQDYPRADRHFALALRRLTRIHVRSVEQPSNPDDVDDFFNWPWMVAGEMGDWMLTDAQVKTLREYLLRGGFIYMDDFWGPEEYARFAESMTRVFPDRPVVEIGNQEAIFHAVYDLDDRYQVLGQWSLRGGGWMGQRAAGTKAHWMGIYDDRNRLMVAMTFNSDVGDSWEWADSPTYPEKFSALGIRLGVNYVVYAMTH